jgi:hypothetical protein
VCEISITEMLETGKLINATKCEDSKVDEQSVDLVQNLVGEMMDVEAGITKAQKIPATRFSFQEQK